MNDNKILLIDIDNSDAATSKVTEILKTGNHLFKYADPDVIAKGLEPFEDFNLFIIVGKDENSILPYFQNIRMSLSLAENNYHL